MVSNAAKAVFAAIMAAVTSVYAALDGENFNLSDKDWVAVSIAALTALGVYYTPNKPAPGERG